MTQEMKQITAMITPSMEIAIGHEERDHAENDDSINAAGDSEERESTRLPFCSRPGCAISCSRTRNIPPE